jgi:predicted nucleotidyltransferase
VEWLAERLFEIPGVETVVLGGSRAQGTERPDSDWDFGLYYRGAIDPDDVRALGFPGEVFAPGDWAYPMNGGAWLTVDAERVDLIYRDLDDVERWIAETDLGGFELFRVPGYLCGMASYVLAGEVALGRTLIGSLPAVAFPDALRASGAARWRYESRFALEHARVHARREDVAGCLGTVSVGILAEAHARLCVRAEWALNEKRLTERADLGALERETFEDTKDLDALVEKVSSRLDGA